MGYPKGAPRGPRPSDKKFEARNAEIVRRYLAGESIGIIAADHQISRQRVFQLTQARGVHRPWLAPTIQVGSKAWKKGEISAGRLPQKTRTTDRMREIVQLREQGLPYTDICERLDCGPGDVRYALLTLRPDLKGWNPTSGDFVRAFDRRGKTKRPPARV